MESNHNHAWPCSRLPAHIPWLQLSLSWGDDKRHAWLIPPSETQRILTQTADFLKPASHTDLGARLAQSFLDKADASGASTEGMTPFAMDSKPLGNSNIIIHRLTMGPIAPLDWNDSEGPAKWITSGLDSYGLAHAHFGPYPAADESNDNEMLAKAEQRIESSLALIEAKELRSSLTRRLEHKPSPSL